jgi:glutamyl-tRNA reductase
MENHVPFLFLLGASHHTAPLAVREKLTLDGPRSLALARRLQATPGVHEFAMLSTCNRVELYSVAASSATADAARQSLADITGCSPAELASVVVQRNNREAIEHLFAVAAGLDSQILGEAEILGQVKDAYQQALEQRWTGPVLNRVFQKTFQAAKHLRTHTAVGEGRISVATVAVDLAGKIFGQLAPVRIAVVGAGDIGLKTVQAFQSRGATAITVASRTLSKAEEAAAQSGGWAASLDELPEILANSDIVACSTAAPYAVVTREMAAFAMKRRPQRPLFLIDLALPRDIEPETGNVPDVYLYNLDDLAKIAESNLAQRRAEIGKCREILATRTAALWPHVEQSLRANLSPMQ